MSRKMMYDRYEIPPGVVRIVTAICADYERRARAIAHFAITGIALPKYVELNAIIDRALEDVEVGVRSILLADIAAGRGYRRSQAQLLVSKNAYYRRRRKLIHDIAIDLSLLRE